MPAMLEHRAGELRHRITIQREDKEDDGIGGQQPKTSYPSDGSGWTNVYCSVAASIEPISGGEAIVARQMQDTVTHKIVMRYRDGITAAMRVLFKGRVFNIREVRNFDERNWKLELRCEENVAI